ncbi:hypothetical protein BASA81_001080 [Batrachochytrium salamandrivorans]|nr:hypothetical protein BASA81_001080 [Batrachochytrium salamandrivorans]
MGGCASIQQQALDAAAKNKLRRLQRLVKSNPELVDMINDLQDRQEGLNPLMLASRNGHVSICRYLVGELRANPNRCELKTGWSSLHFAASFGHTEVMSYLLDQGADGFMLSSINNLTPMDCARMANHVHAVRLLERRLSVYCGMVQMHRSTKFQASVGRMLGVVAKKSLVETMGGEKRQYWVAVTNAYSISGEVCPHCRTKLDKRLGLGSSLQCLHCQRNLGGNSSAVAEVREVAVYPSPLDAVPESTYTFDRQAVPLQMSRADCKLIVSVLRNPTVAVNEDVLMRILTRKPIWKQVAMTRLSPQREYKKLSFVLDANVDRMAQSLRLGPGFAQDLAGGRLPPPPPVVVAALAEELWTCLVCAYSTNLVSATQCSVCTRTRGDQASGARPNVTGEEEVPEHFLCPLSHRLMDDPVVTCDGITYDRANIVAYLATSHLSPVTHLSLPSPALVPNLSLKRAIDEWKATIPMAALVQV